MTYPLHHSPVLRSNVPLSRRGVKVTAQANRASHQLASTRKPQPLMPPDLWIPRQVTEISHRQQVAEQMADILLPRFMALYQAQPKGWQQAFNQEFNKTLHQTLFPEAPAVQVDLRLDLNQPAPHRHGTDFQLNLRYQPAKRNLWQTLFPWLKPKQELHLGTGILKTALPDQSASTNPTVERQMEGLMKREIHDILFALNREYRIQNPSEFPRQKPLPSYLRI